MTLLGPGIPMLWQGEEFLANNDFKHGLTSTWGQDTAWLDGSEEQKSTEVSLARQGHHALHKDLIALRRSSDAFRPEAPISRVMTHNDHRIVAFQRQGESGDSFVVIAHLGDETREGYSVPLPAGRWEQVLNTDAERYGGENRGGAEGQMSGKAALTLPAGGTIVLRKVAGE